MATKSEQLIYLSMAKSHTLRGLPDSLDHDFSSHIGSKGAGDLAGPLGLVFDKGKEGGQRQARAKSELAIKPPPNK